MSQSDINVADTVRAIQLSAWWYMFATYFSCHQAIRPHLKISVANRHAMLYDTQFKIVLYCIRTEFLYKCTQANHKLGNSW